MNCDACQKQICEALDTGRAAPANPDIEQHLTSCRSCREFRDAWIWFDSELTGHAASAALPTDFKAGLLKNLPLRKPQPTPEEVARRRAELEREYQQAIAALNQTYLIPQAIKMLRLLGVGAGFALGGILLAGLIRSVPVAVDTVTGQVTAAATVQLLGCVVGVAAMLYGFRRTWSPAIRNLPWWRSVGSLLQRRTA